MDRLFRIDFYPQDWLIGTGNLTPEECGVYIQICCLIYAQRGPISYDAEELSRKLKSLSERKCEAILKALSDKNKISIIDGKISQKRCENELTNKQNHLSNSSFGGKKRAENATKPSSDTPGDTLATPRGRAGDTLATTEKHQNQTRVSNENNDIVSSDTTLPLSSSSPSPSPSPIEDIINDTNVSFVKVTKSAIEDWNCLAEKFGLAKVQKLTKSREAKLRARLAQCGGVEGWKAAMEKISASSFLTGQRGEWRADFDFVIQEKSFTKIMEGGYDDRQGSKRDKQKTGYLDKIQAAGELALEISKREEQDFVKLLGAGDTRQENQRATRGECSGQTSLAHRADTEIPRDRHPRSLPQENNLDIDGDCI